MPSLQRCPLHKECVCVYVCVLEAGGGDSLDLTFDKQHKRQRTCVWMNLAVDVVILMILNMIFLDRGPSLYFPYQVSIKSFSVLHPTPSLDKSILTLSFHVIAQSILYQMPPPPLPP